MKQLRVQHTFLSLCSVCLIIFSKSIVRKDISKKDVEPFILFLCLLSTVSLSSNARHGRNNVPRSRRAPALFYTISFLASLQRLLPNPN